AALTGYAAYELERRHEHSSSSFARSFNSAIHQIVQGAGGVSQYGRKKHNSNPFNGAVSEDVVVVDEAGNAIKVPEGNWLTGTKDGKWVQERAPDGTTKGQETGTRKDGGHKPGPQHTDPRSLEPHAHVPGVTNPDGTPWLPIRK
ncbi:MAG: hypothetical protein EB051_00765, partial [Chlamydiia bacterium]|nr:hypothetical protein [Chlamydiia bacterium]